MPAKHHLLHAAIACVTIVALGAGYAAGVSAQTTEEGTIGPIEGTVSSGIIILSPPIGGDPTSEGVLIGVPTDPIASTAAPVAVASAPPPAGSVHPAHPTTVIGPIFDAGPVVGCDPNGDRGSLCVSVGSGR
jgi:hypothetical protein